MSNKEKKPSIDLGSTDFSYQISDYNIEAPVYHSVERPQHYSSSGTIECIDAMVAAFGSDSVKDYARVNAFKYLWRAHEKGKEEEDIRKAIWYLKFSIGEDPRGR